MKRTNAKKRQKLMLLVILMLIVSIGYALLTTTLNINGTSKISNAKWDIHWENPQVLSGSVSNTAPTIDSLKTTATFDVTLTTPGDYYAFTIDAVNAGTIDGEISEIKMLYNNAEISQTNALPVYIDYAVTDDNNQAIEVGQRLNVNDTKKYKVVVTYKRDIENNQLPSSDVTLSLKYQVTYVQASSTPQGGGGSNSNTAIQTIISKSSDTTSTTEAVAIQHHATDNTAAVVDYRYMGANPNNYVYFNCTTDDPELQDSTTCETWRVIGIVDGKVKLMKTSSIGTQTFNNALNPDFNVSTVKNTLNTYYNGLNDSAKDVIDSSTWYLGSWSLANPTGLVTAQGTMGTFDQIPEGAYVMERSNSAAGVGISTNYTGNIGLIYPSDYAFSSSHCYSTCLATGVNEDACADMSEIYHLLNFSWDEQIGYGDDVCKNSSWLYNAVQTTGALLMTPYYYSAGDTSFSLFIGTSDDYGNGDVMWGDTTGEYGKVKGVYPTVYLDPEAVFTGDGTSQNPYKISE